MSTKKKMAKTQFNIRLPEPFAKEIVDELNRIPRTREFTLQCIFEQFLSLKREERDAICTPRTFRTAELASKPLKKAA